jgi:hypothetical protein
MIRYDLPEGEIQLALSHRAGVKVVSACINRSGICALHEIITNAYTKESAIPQECPVNFDPAVWRGLITDGLALLPSSESKEVAP